MSSNVVPFPSCGTLTKQHDRQIVKVVRLRDTSDEKPDHRLGPGNHFAVLPAQPSHPRCGKARARFGVSKPLIALPSAKLDGRLLHNQRGNTTRYNLTSPCNALRSCFVTATVLPFLRMEDMPNRILELRRERGLSQEELGFQIGVSKMQISGMERGKRELTLTMMRKLADALGVDTVDILGRSDNPMALDEGARQLVSRYNSAPKDQRENLQRIAEALAPTERRQRDVA
ncbi:MAG: helix-turn-helix domain-containing protein [Sphingomonas sp.]|uniref:helix-turn-helix domain-containing protein n=1 Tax=Sphingomonas sp. TaxID=28214 RepID=UPI00257DD687|nr:helix-turn-helix domain-containing protein [Sphingomonas sp.]MBQ1479848.1 helix-turn-helix domain-containing protein [Sphingomonas sp.]